MKGQRRGTMLLAVGALYRRHSYDGIGRIRPAASVDERVVDIPSIPNSFHLLPFRRILLERIDFISNLETNHIPMNEFVVRSLSHR